MGLIHTPVELFLSARSGVYIPPLVVRRDVAERVGEFDPGLRVGQATEFLFRLALVTPFCFVNRPLLEIDRTVNREDGLIKQTARDEYARLVEHEHPFHKRQKLTRGRDLRTRRQVEKRLAETRNGWANWQLVNGNYDKVRQAVRKALARRFTAKAAAKLVVAPIAPLSHSRSFSGET